jgi:hypothetical protein
MTTIPLGVIIVEKAGLLKSYNIKDFKEEELYKKCGFKKSTDFNKQTEWNIKYDGKKYVVNMYGKLDGKANTENKYDFPPPIDNKLFFGNCVLVAKIKNEQNISTFSSLTIPLWDKLYEKLFGGFEDLTTAMIEDEMEVDELDNISVSKKTKTGGYLKDGFVVDSDDENNESNNSEDEYETETNEDSIVEPEDNNVNFMDIGSELSEESYEYSEEELSV